MNRNSNRLITIIISVLFVFSLELSAQTFPNPNSKAPILLSNSDSSRALAVNAEKSTKQKDKDLTVAFKLNSKIKLFVTNIDLLDKEGANAFRVYAKDLNNKTYRFPVVAIDRERKDKPLYSLTVKLKNEFAPFNQPHETGDLLVSVSHRGLTSNSLLLGLGKTGGFKFEKESEKKPVKKEFPTTNYVGYRWSGDRKRFLEQATFGPTEEIDRRVRRIGLRVWLNEQFTAQYPSENNPFPNDELRPDLQLLGCPPYLPAEQRRTCDRDYYSMYKMQNWFFKEALYGEAQLKHRVTWALSQIWVTSGNKTQQNRQMAEYYKVLARNAFGNYRDLMYEMTLHPTMGKYLDMAQSTVYTPNENYARELLQLFTIGLFMMNQDGTLILDENNRPIPTYTQEGVNNFTKVLTGWTFCYDGNDSRCPNAAPGISNFIDPLFLVDGSHNTEAKTLLDYPNPVNRDIPPNQPPFDDLNDALDNIFHHPNMPPFISKILIQHLVTSDPTPAYVERISAVFRNNGSGVRGDLKAVVKAILLDPEARGDVKTEPNYGKLREPVLFMTNVLRHYGVKSANGQEQSDGVLAEFSSKMGQDPFYAPTVFSYYPPGYAIPGTTYNAPEFWILTTGTSVARLDYINALVLNLVPTSRDHPRGTSLDFSYLTEIAQADPSGDLMINELDRKLMHNTMTPEMKDRIKTEFLSIPIFAPEFRAKTSFYLVVSSQEFQIQK